MSRGPSMTALLGLIAMAGYQNRDKISEWLGGMTGGGGAPAGGTSQGAPSAGGRAAGPAGLPGGLGGLLGGVQGQDPGGFLGGALGGLLEQFKGAGHGDVAESWVGKGENKPIAPPDLERAIGPDTLDSLSKQTGLPREEILSRLSKNLPDAVDRYTPDGRVPA